jgi:pimeloyl-ACP methyl ester carboxylesterase
MVARMVKQLQKNPEQVLDAFFKRVHFPLPHLKQTCTESTESLVEGLHYLQSANLREKVPNIGTPTLILHGSEDQIIPVEAAKWLEKKLPNGILNIFEGGSHALISHNLEDVGQKISQFL